MLGSSSSPQTEIVSLLTLFSHAAGLPEETIYSLAPLAQLRTLPGDTIICREGDECKSLVFIIDGQVGLDMFVPGRGQVRILSLGPGDVVAWTAVIGGGSATSTATVLSGTTVIEILSENLRASLDADHEFGFQFMRWLTGVIGRRLVATRLQLLDLFGEGAKP